MYLLPISRDSGTRAVTEGTHGGAKILLLKQAPSLGVFLFYGSWPTTLGIMALNVRIW